MYSLLDSDVVAYAASHPFSVVSSNISQFGQVAFQINVSNTVNLIAPESVGTQVQHYIAVKAISSVPLCIVHCAVDIEVFAASYCQVFGS